MNTIGWAIFSVGVMFNIDLYEKMKNKKLSSEGEVVSGLFFLFGFIMMIISTFK